MKVSFSFSMMRILHGLEAVVPLSCLTGPNLTTFNRAYTAFCLGDVDGANQFLASVNEGWECRLSNADGIRCSASETGGEYQLEIGATVTDAPGELKYAKVTVYTTDGGKGGYRFTAKVDSYGVENPERQIQVCAAVLARMLFRGQGESEDFPIEVEGFPLKDSAAPKTAAGLVALAASRLQKA